MPSVTDLLIQYPRNVRLLVMNALAVVPSFGNGVVIMMAELAMPNSIPRPIRLLHTTRRTTDCRWIFLSGKIPVYNVGMFFGIYPCKFVCNPVLVRQLFDD